MNDLFYPRAKNNHIDVKYNEIDSVSYNERGAAADSVAACVSYFLIC